MIEDWPDDVRAAPFDMDAARQGVALAESIPALLGGRDAASAS
jgi:hypothetical protein